MSLADSDRIHITHGFAGFGLDLDIINKVDVIFRFESNLGSNFSYSIEY